MKDDVAAELELLLDLALLIAELLINARELDDLLLDVVGALDLSELATLPGADDGAVDEVLVVHKLPFTLGAPALPFA